MRPSVALMLAWCTACTSVPQPQSAVVLLERERFAAMTRQDVDALAPMLAEDLWYCHSDGACETKVEFLQTIRSGLTRYRAIEVIELRPRVEGDTVVVNGTIAVEGVRGGQARNMRIAFTDVYARRDRRWQLIAWQATRLP